MGTEKWPLYLDLEVTSTRVVSGKCREGLSPETLKKDFSSLRLRHPTSRVKVSVRHPPLRRHQSQSEDLVRSCAQHILHLVRQSWYY